MAIPATNYVFDEVQQVITTTNQSTWADLTTWADYTTWINDPVTPMTFVSQVTDLGEALHFNLKWSITCVGTPTFTVYTSTTGAYAGEETSTTINVDDTDVPAFYGRYVQVFVSVAFVASEGIPEISVFDFTSQNTRLEIVQNDINSTTLTGDSSARAIAMPRTVSKVLSMQVTPHASSYVDDSYVADSYIDDTAPGFPAIVSKTRTGPQITFVSTAGTKVDAVFDITMNVLPEQFMDGRNLTIR